MSSSRRTVVVDYEWYEEALALMVGKRGCPHCGSTRKPIEEKTEGFTARLGCLDCDKWWSKPRCL